MSRAWRRSLVAFIAIAAAIVGIVAWAYDDWKSRAVVETQRLGLPTYAANGLRHSLAAADTYALFRTFGLPVHRAARVVERLGQLNEYKEFYFRPARRRDPTREIYKDLYNNAVGIFAAVQLENDRRFSASARLAFIGELTAQNVVMHVFTDPRVPEFPNGSEPKASDLALALGTFKSARSAIYPQMLAALR